MATKKAGPPSHPPYNQMINEAIVDLKERGGSSLPAIKNYVASAYKLPEGWEKRLSFHLRKMTAGGKLVKVKASWKLGEAMKAASTKPKKPAAVKKRAVSAKPAVAKKPKKPKAKKAKIAGVKKAAPAKTKPPAKPKAKPAKKAAAPKKVAPKKAPMKKTAKKAAAKKK